MWKLVIEDDEGKRTVVPLTRDAYTVGRKEGNAIRLTERNVSRDHAKLRKRIGAPGAAAEAGGDKTSYVLDDISSYNGVYVNGLRVAAEQELAHGDLIQIGDYRIVLQDDAVAEAPAAAVAAADLKATVPGYSAARSQAAQLLERPNRLVMLAGPTPGSEYPLDNERMMTIGRAEDATISINHNSVSRLHCEVHALGDGRFEIVDKGSSNGVRVNAAELRRGIIEANDVIELGDVKFKFIGAGQVFRPGATESQQLSAIGDRTASTIVQAKRGASLLPYIVFGAVVAAGAVGAWVLTRPRPEPITASPTPTAPVEVTDQSVLAEALKMCQSGDVDACFEKATTELPEGSLLRDSPDFHGIATIWADKMTERADGEPDLARRRNLLGRVEKASSVDAERRRRAADKLQALDDFEKTLVANDLPIARDGGADTPRPDGGAAPKRAAPTTPTGGGAAAHASASPRAATAAASDMDRVRQLMLQGPPGYQSARVILEAKVTANRASAEEINALKVICRSQGDKACVEHCKQLLAP